MMLRISKRPLPRWSVDSAAVARQAALLVPLVLVNTLAIWGQTGWALDHIGGEEHFPIALGGALTFAAAVESIGVYLAYEAHVARLAGDSAGWLSAAAYAVAAFAGRLNWDHWVDRNQTLALVFAVMSGISPWLWSIRSRSIHREQLRSKGLIEGRMVKFGRARWVLYPFRTYRVARAAVWDGEVDPAVAIWTYWPRSTNDAESTSDQSTDVDNSTLKDRSTASASSTPIVGPAVSADLPPSPAPVGPAPTSVEVVDPPVKRAAALRSVRPSRPKVEVRADSRIAGTDAEKVAALLAAVERGDVTAPLSAADVRSLVVAGGGKDRTLRDEANARIAGTETSGDVT
jgi:hypothetical protein